MSKKAKKLGSKGIYYFLSLSVCNELILKLISFKSKSFMYAWVLDDSNEERQRGITTDVGSIRFETETKVVTLLDAPGHKVSAEVVGFKVYVDLLILLELYY